jgi:hypothetical protein
MAIRTRTYGTGMTEKQVVALVGGTAQDVRDTLRQRGQAGSFEGLIAKCEAWARAVLKSAKYYKGARIVDGEQSNADYADRFVVCIGAARRAIKEGNAEEAARICLTLGGLMYELDLKGEREGAWLTGEKQRGHLGDLRTQQNAQRRAKREKIWARWKSEAAPIRRKHPGLSANAVARIIKDKHNLPDNVRTIARHLT